jgi:hypothetical protein
MWMPPHTTTPPLSTARSAAGTNSPTGANSIAPSSGLWGDLVGTACPPRAQPPRVVLSLVVARAREGEHAHPVADGNLDQDMRRRAETVQPQPIAQHLTPRHPIRTVANQPRAQQRRCAHCVVAVGDGEHIAGVSDGVLGVAAVQRVTREFREGAQVLASRLAVPTRAASPAQPRHAHPLTHLKRADLCAELRHLADNLVPQNQRQLRVRQLAVHNMQVGTAYGARLHANQHLVRLGLRDGHFPQHQRLPDLLQHHRPHRTHTRSKSPAAPMPSAAHIVTRP